MEFKFAVDPDDRTLEFIAGDTNFWQAVNRTYAPYTTDMIDLDDILYDMLFNGFAVKRQLNGYYGDVIDENHNKITLREDTFNILEHLEPEEQQAILNDIATAFIGDYQNIINALEKD